MFSAKIAAKCAWFFFSLCAFAQDKDSSWLRFGDTVSSTDKEAVLSSLKMVKERHVSVPQSFRLFHRHFQGSNLSSVEKYLKDRINVILPKQAKLTITLPGTKFGALPVVNSGGSATTNPSFLFWVASRFELPGAAGKKPHIVDGLEIEGKSAKVIQIGSDFGKYFPLFGLSTLVHEAKHSECPKMLDDATLGKWRDLKDQAELALAFAGHACGYSHSMCPAGSAMEGHLNCDSSFDGPFALQYAFNRAIVKFCSDCAFPERAMMQIFALDAASRLPLPEPLAATVSRTLDRLPDLQKQMQPKTLIEEALESVLSQVDQAVSL